MARTRGPERATSARRLARRPREHDLAVLGHVVKIAVAQRRVGDVACPGLQFGVRAGQQASARGSPARASTWWQVSSMSRGACVPSSVPPPARWASNASTVHQGYARSPCASATRARPAVASYCIAVVDRHRDGLGALDTPAAPRGAPAPARHRRACTVRSPRCPGLARRRRYPAPTCAWARASCGVALPQRELG